MPEQVAYTSNKVTYLDGLRGIAALMVVLTHLRLLLYPRYPDPRFLQTNAPQHLPYEFILEKFPFMIFLIGGSLSVYIFFVHSGFVLSYKYIRTEDPRVLISMAVRRVFRLGIPVAVAVFFAYAIMRLSLMRNVQVAPIAGTQTWFGLLFAFPASLHTAIPDALGGVLFYPQTRYNGVFWTMYIECICSYLVFLALPIIARLPIKALVVSLAAFLFVTPILPTDPVYMPFIVYFYAGVVFCILYVRTDWIERRIPALLDRSRWIRSGLLFLAIVPWLYMPAILRLVTTVTGQDLTPGAPPQESAGALHRVLSWLTIGEQSQRGWMEDASALVIVLVVLTTPRVQRFLNTALCQRLGRWSFSVYLVHLPLICSFSSWLFLVLHRHIARYNVAALLTALISLPVIYAVAAFMARYIDQFAINIGKNAINHLLYWKRQPIPTSVATASVDPYPLHEGAQDG